jgi:hypothetical protein
MGKIATRNAAGVALLVAAVLAVAGCGGSKKSSAAPPVTVTVAATTPAATTTAAQTTTTRSTTTASTGGGTGSGSFKNCGSLTSFGQEFAKAMAASSAAGTSGLGSQAATFKAYADKAPEAIRGDMRTIADALAKYAEALKGVDLKSGQAPSADVLVKLQAAAKEINQPAVAAAGKNISAWVQSNCKG